MVYYYKIYCSEKTEVADEIIEEHQANLDLTNDEHYTKIDFAKYVLIELLDNTTPEGKLWEELGLTSKTDILHKRLMVDAHRVHCRRAIVICIDSEKARCLVQQLSQAKIFKRCICAVVIQDLLSDIKLFEKQIVHFGDKRSQQQLLYVTDLNRYREPESLVRYLETIFSPFGKIISIFIAKDKNGCSYPEGIILFSHLSEAFAAELAYDQWVIGLERLSVTVHHNILLSQCDLRTRLREAQMKNESSDNTCFVNEKYTYEHQEDMNIESLFAFDTFCEKNDEKFNIICKTFSNKLNVPKPGSFINSSVEFVDKYNSHQDNVTQYLEHMAICHNRCNAKSINQEKLVANDSYTIKDIPEKSSSISDIDNFFCNTIPLQEQSNRDSIHLIDVSNLSSTKVDSTYLLNSSVRNYTMLRTVHDNTETSLKCENTTIHNIELAKEMAINSSLLSDKPLLHRYLIENNICLKKTSSSSPKDFPSHNRVDNAKNSSVETFSNSSENCKETLHSNKLHTKCLPSSLKKHSLSQKLSLKSQRLYSNSFSGSILDTESTLVLPSSSTFQTTNNDIDEHEILFDKFESREYHKNKNSQISSFSFPNYVKSFNSTLASTQSMDKENLNDEKVKNCSSDSINAIIPSSTQKISKGSFYEKALTQRGRKSKSKLKKHALEFNVSRHNIDIDKPLRTWLKEELIYSTNNRVEDCAQNSRKIVCATSKRDVLVPVGCSHMTCEFCYPKSTNLIFGFH